MLADIMIVSLFLVCFVACITWPVDPNAPGKVEPDQEVDPNAPGKVEPDQDSRQSMGKLKASRVTWVKCR